jgi:hypothetical protein
VKIRWKQKPILYGIFVWIVKGKKSVLRSKTDQPWNRTHTPAGLYGDRIPDLIELQNYAPLCRPCFTSRFTLLANIGKKCSTM